MEVAKKMITRKSCKLPLKAFQLVGTSRRTNIINKDGNFYWKLKKVTAIENRAKAETV
jgi:hypothetical protein